MFSSLLLVSLVLLQVSSTPINVTVGGFLKNDKALQVFISEVNNQSDANITFIPHGEVIHSDPLAATYQICDAFKKSSGTIISVILDQLDDTPATTNPPEDTLPAPSGEEISLSIALTATYYYVPVMVSTSRSSGLSDRALVPTLSRVVPSYTQQSYIISSIVQRFGWKELAVVHSSDDESRGLLAHLEAASDSRNMFKVVRIEEISSNEEFFIRDSPVNVTRILHTVASEQNRVVVLLTDALVATKVFEAAYRLGITGRDWAWVITERAMSAPNIPQGTLAIQLYPPAEPPTEFAFLVDAVRLMTRALKQRALVSDMSIVRGPTTCDVVRDSVRYYKTARQSFQFYLAGSGIHDVLKNARLPPEDSATGGVYLDSAAESLLPIYRILNRHGDVNSSWEVVGIFNYSAINDTSQTKLTNYYVQKLITQYLELDLSKIVWPGNSTFFKQDPQCIRNTSLNICPIPPDSFRQKKRLRVVTKKSIPFVYAIPRPAGGCEIDPDPRKLNTQLNCTQTDPVTGLTTELCCYGYCIDLLRRLANRTEMETNFMPFKFDLHLVGDGQAGDQVEVNGSLVWNGIILELLEGKADLAVAPLTITPERATVVDFTKPYKYLGFTIIIKKEQTKSNLDSFLQPFEDTLWILVGVSVHVVAVILYLLDRFSPFGRFKLSKSSDTEEDALNLSSAMWFAWGVLLNSGIGEGTPRSFSARVLGMVWAGFAMIIVASYTANLAAFLVLDRPEASISGIDDARLRNPQKDYTFATVKRSPVELYFKRQVEYANMYRTMKQYNYDTLEAAIEAVKSNDLKAFIWDSARLNYEASTSCDLTTVGEVFGRTGYGLAMRKGDTWLPDFSQAILNFHERGFMESLDAEWILHSDTCSQADSSPATLGLANMTGVFIMVAAGIVVGIVLIMIEIAYKRRRGTQQKEIDTAKHAADRWRSNIAKRKLFRDSNLPSSLPSALPFNSIAEETPSSDVIQSVSRKVNTNDNVTVTMEDEDSSTVTTRRNGGRGYDNEAHLDINHI